MPNDIKNLSRRLAENPLTTDYDFWRALRDLNDAIYAIAKSAEPVPIDLLRLRATLRRERTARLQPVD